MDEENKSKHILVADDEPSIRELLTDLLSEAEYQVTTASTGDEVLEKFKQLKNELDLIIMDVRMPGQDGLAVLKAVQTDANAVPVIIMTGFGSSNIAIKAMQIGAYDYITKPFDVDDMQLKVQRLFERQSLASQVRELRSKMVGQDPSEKIIGNSSAMLDIYKRIGQIAGSDATVLVTGETGTGKELVANILHTNSRYSHGPLVKVNCAALPETLLESELFGHEAGAFTGAVKQRKGRFEMANKGTIFLDEVGEMTLGTQKKLLRVLQEREFDRVGGSLPIKVDVRVIAATNRDLQTEVNAGTFREDLYFRLNIISIHMPPLRDRDGDIPLLVEYFLDKHRYTPSSQPARVSEEAMQALENYNWPGNVRELENTIERAVIYARGGVITSQHLLLPTKAEQERGRLSNSFFVDQLVKSKNGLKASTEQFEKAMVSEALLQTGNNETEAAQALGLEVSELQKLITKHALN